jgi:DNA-directed RNA polymerase specialized sigma24 family protein
VGAGVRRGRKVEDPAELVATVAMVKRAVLMHVNRHRLRVEDLEDCYSQAVLELIAHVRSGGAFADERHAACALELRFGSRITDRCRALAGRSPMQAALETSLSLADDDDGPSVIDRRADTEQAVIVREELRRVRRAVPGLTSDQRLALAVELDRSGVSPADFCASYGWSPEKFRKVSQRGRARLAALAGRAGPSVTSRRVASVESAGTLYDHRSVDP